MELYVLNKRIEYDYTCLDPNQIKGLLAPGDLYAQCSILKRGGHQWCKLVIQTDAGLQELQYCESLAGLGGTGHNNIVLTQSPLSEATRSTKGTITVVA